MRAILEGDGRSAASEAVALNAAAALVVGGRAEDLSAGLETARDLLSTGAPGATLAALVGRSQELADG